MRLIDADALIRDMEENPPSYGDMDRVIAAVNNAPTVEKKDSEQADYNPIVIEHMEQCEYDIYEKFAIKVAEETDKFIFEAIFSKNLSDTNSFSGASLIFS
jgi:hypothetical protein